VKNAVSTKPEAGETVPFVRVGASGGQATVGPGRVGVGTASAPRSSCAVMKYENARGHPVNTMPCENTLPSVTFVSEGNAAVIVNGLPEISAGPDRTWSSGSPREGPSPSRSVYRTRKTNNVSVVPLSGSRPSVSNPISPVQPRTGGLFAGAAFVSRRIPYHVGGIGGAAKGQEAFRPVSASQTPWDQLLRAASSSL